MWGQAARRARPSAGCGAHLGQLTGAGVLPSDTGRDWVIRKATLYAGLLSVAASGLVAGCATSEDAREGPRLPSSAEQGVSLPGTNETPTATEQSQAPDAPLRLSTEVPARTERRVERVPSFEQPSSRVAGALEPAASQGEGLRFTFVDTPVRDVADAILTGVLGEPFVIDSGISETITLRTTGAVPRNEILGVFDALLRSRGLRLSKEAGLFRISRATGNGEDITGYGTDVHRLSFVPAQEAQQLLAAAVPADRLKVTAGSGQTLLVQGPAAERARARSLIEALDVSALAGAGMMVVSLEQADAGQLAVELEDIFGLANQGSQAGSIRFMPIRRLNAVVVIAKRPALAEQALSWISRLDRAQPAGGRRFYVYNVQNRRAASLAAAIQDLLGGEAQIERLAEGEGPRDAGIIGVADGNAPSAMPRAADPPPGTVRPWQGENGSGREQDRQDADGIDTSRLRVVVDVDNNALLISASQAQYRLLRDLVGQLDVAPLQVMIEATIIEVSLGDNLRYGVQYALSTGGIGKFENGAAVFTPSGRTLPLAPNLPGFAFFLAEGNAPEVIIEALSSVTDIKVVSSPKMVVLDNQVANLQAGDSVPTIVQQSTNTSAVNQGATGTSAVVANAVEYRDTGVNLRVTPRVGNSGQVHLDIIQEVSDVTQTTTSSIDSPTFRQRKMSTTVTVQDGQTVMLGGLIQERQEDGRSGVPLLMDVPLVGHLFSSDRTSTSRTELIAVLTPRVIRNAEDADNVTQTLARKFRALSDYDPERESFLSGE